VATREAFDGDRQREVLTKLQTRSGYEATELSHRVGLSYPQYLRYVWGKLPLRADQLPAFARAYGVSPIDLAAEIAGQDVYATMPPNEPAPEWTFRTALRGHLPEDMIDRLAATWEGRPILNQQAAAEALIEMAQEYRESVTNRPHATAG
jgi:hypothetical protein